MNPVSRETCLAWLSGTGLSPEQMGEMLAAEPDPIRLHEAFLREGEKSLPFEISPGQQRQMRKTAGEEYLTRWGKLMAEHQILVMTMEDDLYPARLRPLPEAPAILFYQGDPAVTRHPSVAVVGSRRATYKGQEATRQICEALSRSGIAIVSGLAYGIDAAAHKGCLKGGSPTIAVLGCGLDQDYPAENAPLRREIIAQGGLVISEYTPGEKPLGWHFPWRNRIISGLGNCLMLMEARIQSGSMTSVQHALNQGRDVFVYPGEPESPQFEGNHQLLREGAIYFTRAQDLMEDMGWLDKMKDVGQNTHCASGGTAVSLSAAEQKVVDQLDRGEQGFDQLCEALGMPAAMLSATLSMLQIQGLVEALPGKIYRRIRE